MLLVNREESVQWKRSVQNVTDTGDNSKKCSFWCSMEVDKNNFEEYLPKIEESISKADFVGKRWA